MRYTRIKLVGIGVCACLLFFILFNGQVVGASKTSTNQTQSSQTGVNASKSVSKSASSWDKVGEVIKIVAPIFTIVGVIICIYKFILEKRYDIESIVICLIHKKPLQNMQYSKYKVMSITKEEKEVALISAPNPYYFDISINFSIPEGRKLLNNIFIKKICFNINGYELVCDSENVNRAGIEKCMFNKQNKTCNILLKWPSIKGGESRKDQEEQKAQKDREALNQFMAFRNPEKIDMYMNWYPQVMLSPIVGYFLPKRAKIKFEKIEHENGTTRIGIKSIGIFEGRKKWIK